MERLEIIKELVADHWQIRDLVKELRDESVPNNKKHSTLKLISPWLKVHASGEEKTINAFAKGRKSLRVLGYEDGEEHETINELYRKLSHTRNPYLWAARLHLMCELIEHHLDEEEEEFFPQLRKEISAEESENLARQYRILTKELDPRRPKPKHGLMGWLSGRPEPANPESIVL